MQWANLVRIVHIYWQRRNQKSCLFQGELPQLSTLQFGLTTPMPGGSSRTYASCNTCCGLAYDITGLGSFTLWDPHWGIVHTQLLPIVCTYAPLHCQPQHQVLTCVQSWVSQDHLEPLSSANWFSKCHGIESYTCNSEMAWIGQRRYPHCGSWTPAPGVSPVAWTWSAPMGLGQIAHIMSSIGVHPLGFLSLPCTSWWL